jgi:predicted amidohydrolase
MRLALAQYAPSDDMDINLRTALEHMEAAAVGRASLIVFPELCLSPFFPQLPGLDASRYALAIDDDRVKQFQQMSARLQLASSPNVYLTEGARRFDASLLIDSAGDILGISKMVHIAQLPGFYEQDYYAPSDTGFHVYNMTFGRIGIVVCFDRHYPESVRTCALRGAELIVIPTANRVDEPRDLYVCEVRAMAMQNGVYVAMCNRVGREGAVTFCGESVVVDPFGNLTAQAGEAGELLCVDIDLSNVAKARKSRPYLQLRRPETYER